MRSCEGLVDSLLYVIKACVNTSDFDSKVCTHNTQAHRKNSIIHLSTMKTDSLLTRLLKLLRVQQQLFQTTFLSLSHFLIKVY